MNFKIPNICAKSTEKNPCLVYFEQISLPKIKKMSKLKFLEKNSSSFSKKLKLFGFKTQQTGSESLHPFTIKVVQKKPAYVYFSKFLSSSLFQWLDIADTVADGGFLSDEEDDENEKENDSKKRKHSDAELQ